MRLHLIKVSAAPVKGLRAINFLIRDEQFKRFLNLFFEQFFSGF
jgi:hypothetical protein